jgi:hypothetical protein
MRTYRGNVNEVKGAWPEPEPELSAKELLFKLEKQYSYFRDDCESHGWWDKYKKEIAQFEADIRALRIEVAKEAAKQGETK